MRLRLLAAVLFLVCGGGVYGAAPILLDFEDLRVDDALIRAIGPIYTSQGFQLTASVDEGYGNPPNFLTIGTFSSSFDGSTSVYNGNALSRTTLTRSDGGAFNLFSIDLAELPNFDSEGNPIDLGSFGVTFVGKRRNGTVVQNTAIVQPFPSVSTFTFHGFADLVSVEWMQGSGGPPGPTHQFDNIRIDASGPPAYRLFTDEAAFLKAAGNVTVEGFESLPHEWCPNGGAVQATTINVGMFSVNTRPYIVTPGVEDTVFLCVGTASNGDVDPRPTQGINALIAGSNTGSTYVLEFLLSSPTRAIAFDFTDVAETGDFLFAQPDTGGSATIASCCNGPHEGFFGYVAQEAFSRFYVYSTGRVDGSGLDRIQIGVRAGRPSADY